MDASKESARKKAFKLKESKDHVEIKEATPDFLPALPEVIENTGAEKAFDDSEKKSVLKVASPANETLSPKSPARFKFTDGAAFAFLAFVLILHFVLNAQYQIQSQTAGPIQVILGILFTAALTLPSSFWFINIQSRLSKIRGKSKNRTVFNNLCATHPIIVFICAGLFISLATHFHTVLLAGLVQIVILFAYVISAKWLSQILVMPFEIDAVVRNNAEFTAGEKIQAIAAAAIASIFSLAPLVLPLLIMLGMGASTALINHPFLLLFSVLLSGLGFIFVRNKLVKVEATPLPSAQSAQDKVVVEDGDVDFSYNHFVELTKFIKQKVAMRSPWKIGVLVLILLAAVAGNLHTVILAWIVQILAGNGVATHGLGLTFEQVANPMGNLNALANSGLVFSFVVLTGLAMLLSLSSFMRAPKRFAIGKRGVKLLYQQNSGINNVGLDWQDMKQIRLIRPSGKASALSDRLIFEKHCGPPLTIKLAGLGSSTEKEKLLAAIDRYGPQVLREAAVEETLRKPMERNYTELWLQALAAPPKRERLKPMVGGAVLNEGRFRITRELGVGGQGFAYLAQDLRTDADVVLKEFVLPVFVDINARRQSLENFEKEAKLLSSLEHPQVVKLEGFFVEDHRAYLVLEHIDGENLRQIVERDGPMPEERICELAAQMCEILTYLHGLAPPLVHRDFTPDNLILRKDGTLKLIDFNVAQQVEVAVTGTVVGKQSYLPPEQFRGQAVPASDLYAFGATLYFLAGGKDPTPISVAKPLKDGLPVSTGLDALITALTQMEAAMRPLSARAVAETLAHQHGDEDGKS